MTDPTVPQPASQTVSKGNARRTAVAILGDVLVKGRSLSSAKGRCQTALQDQRDRALAMELVNGVLRWRFRLEFLLSKLLKKPLRKKDADLQFLLLTLPEPPSSPLAREIPASSVNSRSIPRAEQTHPLGQNVL